MITPEWYPSEKQLRQFAVVSLFGFGLFGLIAKYVFGTEIGAYIFWAVGGLTFISGVARPKSILIVYTALLAIAVPIGWLVSAVMLRTLFYGVLTPLGWCFRLRGRDPLRLKKPRVDSFWQDRHEGADATSYYRQS